MIHIVVIAVYLSKKVIIAIERHKIIKFIEKTYGYDFILISNIDAILMYFVVICM